MWSSSEDLCLHSVLFPDATDTTRIFLQLLRAAQVAYEVLITRYHTVVLYLQVFYLQVLYCVVYFVAFS